MKEIVLEGKKFINSETSHKILKSLFEFPDYYGENLDAFWDCITDCTSDWVNGENVKIIWKDFSESHKNLGKESDILLELFQEASKKYGGFTIEVIP